MRLGDIMSKPLRTVERGNSIRDAWEVMRRAGVHHLVVMERGKVIGVVSHHDLAAAPARAESVAQVMAAPVVTATPRTTVREAANLLRGRGIGCLPVLSGTKPVGIVTVSDVQELVGRGVERPIAESTRWTLKHRGPWRRTPPRAKGQQP